MSTEKSVDSLSSLSESINSLKFGESLTINLSDLIRKTLKDMKSEREGFNETTDSTKPKSNDSGEFSPFNTVNS